MGLPFNLADTLYQLQKSCDFISAHISDTYPMFATTKYLAPNSIFFEVQGRAGYFSPKSATSEATTVLAVASFKAYQATGDIRWKTHGIGFIDAYANYFYIDNPFTADISAGINSAYCRNHWLICAYDSITTEGNQTGNDPFNYGTFTSISFTSGIGAVETDLSRVFKVYTGDLYYKNLYAPVINGNEVTIDYWIAFDNTKTYPDGSKQANSGGEPIGRIKLTSSLTGTYKIAYTRRNGAVVTPPTGIRNGSGLYEPYPCWFPCIGSSAGTYTSNAFDANWWGYEAYKLAYQNTSDPKYLNAANITKFNCLRYINLSSQTYYYKKDPSDNPLRLPGSYFIQTNTSINGTALTTPGYTATRSSDSGLTQWLRLDVNAITTPTNTSFPTMEVQNYAAQTALDPLVNIYIETRCTQACNLKIKLSISPDALDFSQEYIYFFHIPANTTVTRTLNYLNFVTTDVTNWYPWIAETPVFTFNGSTYSIIDATINNQLQTVVSCVIPDNTAGVGFINAKYTNVIPSIMYSLTGECQVRIKDDSANYYYVRLTNTSGEYNEFTITWADLGVSPRLVTEIAFLGVTACTLNLWYAGETPSPIPSPSKIYKATVSNELKTAYTWWIGDFYPTNNILDKLKYTPGATPFVINTLNGAVSGYRGAQFYMGYQSPYSLQEWGYSDYARNVVNMMNDAQEAYKTQSINRLKGLLQQVFLPYSVENIPFLDKIKQNINIAGFPIPFMSQSVLSKDSDAYSFDVFAWEGLDPNTRWSPYCFRAMKDLSKYYSLNKSDLQAKKVLTTFINFISTWVDENGINPITDIPPSANPQQNYHEPHAWALIGSCAIWCYINRINRPISFKVIQHAYTYITSQWVDSGTMAGMWCAGQPNSVIGGITYKEFFSFWAGEIIDFLAELVIYQLQLESDPAQSLTDFPSISCATNSVADYIQQITYNFPTIDHVFADGSSQQILLSRSPVGDELELRFEAMSADKLKTLFNWCNTTYMGATPFRFPTSSLNYNDLEGKWVLTEQPIVETLIHNKSYGLYNCTIKCRKVEL